MRHLAAMGVVRQVDVDRFAPTKFTKLLQEQVWADTLKFMWISNPRNVAMRPG